MSYQMLIDPFSSNYIKQKSSKKLLEDVSTTLQFENSRNEDEFSNKVDKNESLPAIEINQSHKKGIITI